MVSNLVRISKWAWSGFFGRCCLGRDRSGYGRVEKEDEGIAVEGRVGKLTEFGGEDVGSLVCSGFVAAGEQGVEEGGGVSDEDDVRERREGL